MNNGENIMKSIEKKHLPLGALGTVQTAAKLFKDIEAAQFFADVLNEGDEDSWTYEVIGVTGGGVFRARELTNIVAYAIEVSDEDEEFVAYWTEI